MSEILTQVEELAEIATEGLSDATLELAAASLASMRDAIAAEVRRSPVLPPIEDVA